MTKFKQHHGKACTGRLYLPREKGGRSLINLKTFYSGPIIKRIKYFNSKNDSPLHKTIIKADRTDTSLNLSANRHQEIQLHHSDSHLIDMWLMKTLHEKRINIVKNGNFDKLKEGLIYPEAEGFVIVIQDQIMNTRNYKNTL